MRLPGGVAACQRRVQSVDQGVQVGGEHEGLALVGIEVTPGEQVGCAGEALQQEGEAREGVDAGRGRQGAQLRRRDVAGLR